MIHLDGGVHDENDGRDDDGEAPEVVPEEILKQGERCLCLGEEHVVRGGVRARRQGVDEDSGDRHAGEHDEGFGDLPGAGLYVAADGEHDGVERQQDVDGVGVQMHEIEDGELRPGGEEDGHHRPGDADHVEKIVEQIASFPKMHRDDENVDGAQLQRQVIERPQPCGQEHDPLGDLVQKDQPRDRVAEATASRLTAAAVGEGADHDREQKGEDPEYVRGVKMLKSDALLDTATRFPKILHKTISAFPTASVGLSDIL